MAPLPLLIPAQVLLLLPQGPQVFRVGNVRFPLQQEAGASHRLCDSELNCVFRSLI